jgi:hypothetical protein
MPKVLVGTLYSGEAEFQRSSRSIESQEECLVTHRVIQGLSEYKAHNELWELFNDEGSGHELLVKIDADTILGSHIVFKTVHKLLLPTKFDGVQLDLFDQLSESRIKGMGFFRPSVYFRKSRSRLFADRAIDRRKFQIADGKTLGYLDVVGIHSPTPHERQAFRYGFHRIKKGQFELMNKVIGAWENSGDERRAWAIAGAIHGIKGRHFSVSYNSWSVENSFRKIKRMGLSEFLIDNASQLQKIRSYA